MERVKLAACYVPVLIFHIEFDKGYKGSDSMFNPTLISNLTLNSEYCNKHSVALQMKNSV